MSRLPFVKWIAVLTVLLALAAPVLTPDMSGTRGLGRVAVAQEENPGSAGELEQKIGTENTQAPNTSEEPEPETLPESGSNEEQFAQPLDTVENPVSQTLPEPAGDETELSDLPPPVELPLELPAENGEINQHETQADDSEPIPPAENDSFGTLSIMVLDAQTGAPIAGATVVVNHIWTGGTVATGLTSNDGRFVVDQLPAGDYAATVSYPSYLDGADPSFALEGDTLRTISLAPVISSDTVTPILTDEELDSAASTNKVDAAAIGTLTITVLDQQTSAPIAGATIQIREEQSALVKTGVTGLNGVFAASQLATGEYTVAAQYPGYLISVTSLLVDGDASTTLYLKPAVFGSLTVNVLDDQTDAPIAEASVTVWTQGKMGAVVAEGTTNANGVFVADQMPPEALSVVVSHPGYFDNWSVAFASSDMGEAVYAGWDEVTASSNTEITIRLTPRKTGVLTITVLDDETDLPIAGAAVEITDQDIGDTIASGYTDDSGVFVSDQLPGGPFYLAVSHLGYFDGWDEFFANGDTEITIRLVPIKAGILTVTVLDDETDLPIAGASVWITHYGDPVTSGYTNGSGVFASGQLPGNYHSVAVFQTGYFDNWDGAFVVGDTAITIRLTPRKTGMLTVTVIDNETDLPIAGAAVEITDQDTDIRVANGDTNGSGVFASAQLSGGYYDVAASHSGYFDRWDEVFVDGDTGITVRLKPIRAGILTLTVLDGATNLPIVGAAVEITEQEADDPAAHGSTNGSGIFATGQLAGGYYNAVVSHPGYFDDGAEIFVSGDTALTLRLAPRIAGILTVTVLDDETGLPIAGAAVEITDQETDDIVASGSTNASGVFATDQLPSDYYLVRVSHPDYLESEGSVFVQGDAEITTRLKLEMIASHTPTATNTPTNTSTSPPTKSATATNTPVNTSTSTPVGFATRTQTPVATQTSTSTMVKTAIQTPWASHTPRAVPTGTAVPGLPITGTGTSGFGSSGLVFLAMLTSTFALMGIRIRKTTRHRSS